jgi:hypothetical protein
MCVPAGRSRATTTIARATVSALIGRYFLAGPTRAMEKKRAAAIPNSSPGRF